MDKKQIRKEIAVLINSIKEHSDSIGDKEHIPQLELELVLHKIEKLYQKSIVFNYLNSVPEIPVVKAVPVMPVEVPETAPPKVEARPVTVPEAETPAPELPKAELKQEVLPPEREEPKPEVKAPETKPVDLFGTELPPATEKPKPEKKAEKPVSKPATNIQMSPVSDLRSAIGLNDKFQFANELFAGEMKEYDIALQQLNSSESAESAMNYFNSLQQLYNWDMENDTVKRLLTLVQRRYS